jgi:hypothetical protein
MRGNTERTNAISIVIYRGWGIWIILCGNSRKFRYNFIEENRTGFRITQTRHVHEHLGLQTF